MSTAKTNPAGPFVRWMLKFMLGYCLCEMAVASITLLVLKLPVGRIVVPFLMVLLPTVVSGPLIYSSYSLVDRQKLRSFVFALAVFATFLLSMLALLWSAMFLDIVTRASANKYIMVTVIGSLLAAASVYYQTDRRLLRKGSTPALPTDSAGAGTRHP